MQQRTIQLTSAQILALGATPVEVVAAPGAGYALIPFATVAVLHFGAAAYILGSQVNLYLGAKGNAHLSIALTAAFVNLLEDSIAETLAVGLAALPDVLADGENQALNLSNVGAEFTTGDGTITVTVFYGTARVS